MTQKVRVNKIKRSQFVAAKKYKATRLRGEPLKLLLTAKKRRSKQKVTFKVPLKK